MSSSVNSSNVLLNSMMFMFGVSYGLILIVFCPPVSTMYFAGGVCGVYMFSRSVSCVIISESCFPALTDRDMFFVASNSSSLASYAMQRFRYVVSLSFVASMSSLSASTSLPGSVYQCPMIVIFVWYCFHWSHRASSRMCVVSTSISSS